MTERDESEPQRRRKAWRVGVRGYDMTSIVYAASAGKARVAVWRSMDDGRARIVDVTARRAPESDMLLPVPDEATLAIPEGERDCLMHAFGADCGNPLRAGYRDYFYTTRDDPPLVALTGRGLMAPMAGDKWGDGMTYFVLTPAGKRAALSLVPEYGR